MLLLSQILLAIGVDDLLKYLTPFVFLLVWVISQILEAKNKSTPKPTPPAPPAPPQPTRPELKPVQEAVAAQSDPLRKQVDEFLRRAGNPAPEPKGRPDRQRPRPATSDIEILIDDQASALRRERLSEPLRPLERTAPKKAQPPARPARPGRPADEVRRGPSIERVGESMSDSVQAIEAATARLGQRIVQEDAQFDVELHSRFDHRVGTLGVRSEPPKTEKSAPEADSPAAQIAAMLARPQGAQQAVVLNEILRRPDDRW